MQLSRNFPADLVIHEQAVRVPSSATNNEQLWVPGETEQHGKFQRYIRYLLVSGEAGEVRRLEELAALPLQLQRCIIDIRTGFLKWGGHGHKVAFQVEAPLGQGGKTVSADALTSKPDPAVAVWAPGQARPEQSRVASVLPAGTRLESLQNGWLAHGQSDVLLAHWRQQTAAPITPRTIGVQPASFNVQPDASLEAGLAILSQSLRQLDTRPRPGPEQQLESQIDVVTAEFLTFGQALQRRIDAMPQDTQHRQALARTLRLPFEIVAANRSNPLRNGMVAARLGAGQGVPPEVFLLAQQDPNHFAYESLPIDASFMAAYAPTRRSMILPPQLDPRNPMLKWIKFHELIHVFQFAQHRRRMGIEQLIRFMSTPGEKPVLLGDEVQAYGYELEGINLELDGELRHIARSGGSIDGERMRQRLGIDDQFRVPMQFLAHLGTLYFRDNREDGTYPDAYVHSVLQCLIHDGQTPYQLNGAGQPQKIRLQS